MKQAEINRGTVKTITCGECGLCCQRFGKHRNGLKRFRCPGCKRTLTETHERTLGAMYAPKAKVMLALQLLLEGNSIRSTSRITGLDQNTIMKALVLAGERCEKVMARLIVNVPVKDIQCDEIWSFIGKKQKSVEPGDDPNLGDAYCFTAIERHSKLILNFALGKRNQRTTDAFIEGLRHATANQNFQVSTDGFAAYVSAIDNTLSDRVDFAQLIKVYRATPEGERRYSPAEVVSTEVVPVVGSPDPARICTSHVERQNLTMRMQIRRFTRLTNGFSKKFENHWAALSLYFGYYNFCRIHKTIRVTPAMEAGITDHVWDLEELLK
jgi:transposase-like protein/IS1 family transposase